MKRRQSLVLVVALVTAAWLQAQAVTTETEVNVEPRVSSAFVWRGQVLNDEWCFQPTVALLGNRFSITALGNWDLTSVTNASKDTRVDTTLDCSTTVNSQIVSAGLVAYIYQDGPAQTMDDTFEVYVRDTVDVFLMPSLSLYYDFSEIKGFYGTFGLAHSVELVKDTLSVELKTTLGVGDGNYNDAVFSCPEDPATGREAFDADKTALVDLTASVSLPLWPRDDLVITPTIKYSTLLDSEIRDAVDRAGQDTGLVYFSLAVGYVF